MIESLENKKVKNWTKLHQKKYRDEEFLLLDRTMIEAARDRGYLKTLIWCKDPPFTFDESYEVSRDVLNKIAKRDDLDCIGIGKKIECDDAYGKRVMILEDLSDPLNIGRIFESAYLFGFDSIILSPNCADIYHPKCLQAAGPSFFNVHMNIAEIPEEIEKLKNAGFRIYATGLRDNTLSLDEVVPNEKMAFILGNEGSGVKDETFRIADETVKIDMHNIDSLNVAMAGAIVMYRFANM